MATSEFVWLDLCISRDWQTKRLHRVIYAGVTPSIQYTNINTVLCDEEH